jgi:hypothetical protein
MYVSLCTVYYEDWAFVEIVAQIAKKTLMGFNEKFFVHAYRKLIRKLIKVLPRNSSAFILPDDS